MQAPALLNPPPEEGVMLAGLSATGILDTLLQDAIAREVSDIHLNPEREHTQVRMRIDGMLEDTHVIPRSSSKPVLARIKILTGLRTDEHQKPQDGRFQQESATGSIDVRVALAPGYHGESAVLRLLTSPVHARTLRSLGCRYTHDLMLRRALERSQGLVLATGPTGSGKTTLLYALLSMPRENPYSRRRSCRLRYRLCPDQ